MANTQRISVIGLGYVGLPLAVALAKHFPVVGFDIDEDRVTELETGYDRTGEIDATRMRASSLRLTSDEAELDGTDMFIVTVPTPVDGDNQPDLRPVRGASATVGRHLRKGNVVVYESTVYPGVTEDICGPDLEEASSLKCGQDFFLGYSPERINPGDREHTVDRITKVIAGQTPEVTAQLAEIYGAVTSGGVFPARDIKTAEAAKVIENAQRDINIAFVNEVAMIFQKLGLSAYDVLEAAGTKWNFLKFSPGLVGGHCIGVDPFYLAFRAQQVGHDPAIILSGRRTNDSMGEFIAERIASQLGDKANILLLGLTFKENVPDLRNSKVIDVITGLLARGHTVTVHDPFADPDEARQFYAVDLISRLDGLTDMDAVVGAVPHDVYKDFRTDSFAGFLKPGGLVADIKGMWREVALPDGIRRWQL